MKVPDNVPDMAGLYTLADSTPGRAGDPSWHKASPRERPPMVCLLLVQNRLSQGYTIHVSKQDIVSNESKRTSSYLRPSDEIPRMFRTHKKMNYG